MGDGFAKEFLGEIVGGEQGAAAEDDQAFQRILELAHVAGPVVPLEGFEQRIVDLARLEIVGAADLVEEEAGEQGEVLRSLAQRR